MPYFFNGRLWTSPAVMSAVNDSAMANQNLSVGNIAALLGLSTGGAPNTPLVFGSPAQAIATLVSGELLTAVLKAFNPSSEVPGPSTVVAIRVNPAVQAALTLNDASSNPVINLTSTDYGQYTNGIKVKVEAASTLGLKITTQLGTSYFSQDNIAYQPFTIQYSGAAASATMSVTNSTVTLFAPAGTAVATIPLATYPTIQALVDRINTVSGFTATVAAGFGPKASLNGLDNATAVDVKTALYTANAHLQAVVDWFNGGNENFVTATRVANAGTLPAVLPFTYLTGGSDGTTTNTNWSNAFTTLQTVDCQWVTPISSDPNIHAMTDSHVQYMSTTGRKERRAIVGTALGTTDISAISLTKAINSDRTAFVHLGMYDYDINGNYVLFSPYMLAATIAGAFSGVAPGVSLTHKSLSLRGIERNLRNPTDTDALIQGGVLCVENTKTGYRVVQSISTWLNNGNYNRVEISTGAALDFVSRNVREALVNLLGAPGSPISLSAAVSRVDSVLRQLAVPAPSGPGTIVGDSVNPAYKNITATLTGNVMAVSFQCSPVVPINYIPVTVFAVPYTGTASA